MNCKKNDKDALDILKEASKKPMYKSTTDQGKAINLFNFENIHDKRHQ
jgi:endothelin-converting enzyme/putative endopeptidase